MTDGNDESRTADPGSDRVAHLPVYLRILVEQAEAGTVNVSSEELADFAGVNAAKVRKDLSYLGTYGTRGVGYEVEYLIYQVRRELGLTHDWPVVIVGAGNLGQALAGYGGVSQRGFPVAGLVDVDDAKIGTVISGVRFATSRSWRPSCGRRRCRSASSKCAGVGGPRKRPTGSSRPGSPASSTSRRSF